MFTLDENGNIVGSVQTEPLVATPPGGYSVTFGYNARKNRLVLAGDLTYTYDDEGQLGSAGEAVCVFNYDHKLSEIHNGTSAQYFYYDVLGNRLVAERDGVTTRYIYDPFGNLMAEADELGQITRKYIYGKGLIAMETPSARYCYHFNATGSTVAITDMSQVIVNKYAYDPFGQILAEQEAFPQPFKFVGQFGVMAEPGGLYYMRARYYDPAVGRFISEDPIGFAGGDVNLFAYVDSVGKPFIGTNLYIYASNNPINRIDPFGLFDNPLPRLPTFSQAFPESDYVAPFADIIAGGLEGGFATAFGVGTVVSFLSGPEFWLFTPGAGAVTIATGWDAGRRTWIGIDRLGRKSPTNDAERKSRCK